MTQVPEAPVGTLDRLYLATHPLELPESLTLLDDLTWDTLVAIADQKVARLTTARMEVRAYESMVGQSTREDYHKAFAFQNGMHPITSKDWSNGYTSFSDLAFLLNRLENATAGMTVTQRHTKVLTWEPYDVCYCASRPVTRINGVLRALSLWASACGGSVSDVSRFRITTDRQGQQVANVFVHTTKQRPAEVRYVEVESPLKAEWYNPVQVEGGMTLLEDSLQRDFTKSGVEGLSVLIDADERMHIVYWTTTRFSHRAIGRKGDEYVTDPQRMRRPAKKPLAVHSLPIGADPDEAVQEMYRISQGMTRVARDGQRDGILPDVQADLDDQRPGKTSAPDITGSHEWLTLIADQRATGQVYRPHGATSDD